MQKDIPQPTDANVTAGAQLLGQEIVIFNNLAIDFLTQFEQQVKGFFCEKGQVRSDIAAIEDDATVILTTIAGGVSATVVAFLLTQPGFGLLSAAIPAAATVSALVAAFIVKVGIVQFCRLGVAAITSGR
jgi:hypothetical protein